MKSVLLCMLLGASPLLARTYTNSDLKKARGHLTFSTTIADATPSAFPPEARKIPQAAKLAARYVKLLAERDDLEGLVSDLSERLSEATDAFYVVRRGGKRVAKGRIAKRLQAARRKLHKVASELETIERRARRLGLSTVGLLRVSP